MIRERGLSRVMNEVESLSVPLAGEPISVRSFLLPWLFRLVIYTRRRAEPRATGNVTLAREVESITQKLRVYCTRPPHNSLEKRGLLIRPRILIDYTGYNLI